MICVLRSGEPINKKASELPQSCSLFIMNPTRYRKMLRPALLQLSCVHIPGAIDNHAARWKDPAARSVPLRAAYNAASESSASNATVNDTLVLAALLRMRMECRRWFAKGANFASATEPAAAGLGFSKLELDQNPESYRKTVPPGDSFIASAKPSKHRA